MNSLPAGREAIWTMTIANSTGIQFTRRQPTDHRHDGTIGGDCDTQFTSVMGVTASIGTRDYADYHAALSRLQCKA